MYRSNPRAGTVDDLEIRQLLPRLTCGLLLFSLNTTRAATFDLGSNGTLSLEVPAAWTTSGRQLSNHGYDLRFEPPAEGSPQICFTVLIPPDGKGPDRAEADTTFREIAQFAKDSVEQKADIKGKKLSDGFAGYASFTDPDLVGKTPGPGGWKTSTSCVMVLGGRIVVSATIFSDDLATRNFDEFLSVLWSARLQPREERKGHRPLPDPSAVSHQRSLPELRPVTRGLRVATRRHPPRGPDRFSFVAVHQI